MPENKQYNWLKDADTIKSLIAILDKYNLAFLPMAPNHADKTKRKLKRRNLTPLSISNIAELTDWVLLCRTIRPYTALNEYDVIYLTKHGTLDKIIFTANQLIAGQSNGLRFELRPIESLSLHDYRSRITRLNTGKSVTTPDNFDIVTYHAMLRMPDKIADTELDSDLLKQCFENVAQGDCTNVNAETVPDFANGRYVGNNLLKYGLTPLDYVRARYSAKLLPELIAHRRYRGTDGMHPASIYITNYAYEFQPAQWPEYEKVQEQISIKCNQHAYDILTKINAPTFEREPENNRPNTFDRIRIYLGVKSKLTVPNRVDFIKRYRKDIAVIAINKIIATKAFQKVDIPANFLKLSSMTLTAQDELELVFELKTPKN